MFAIERGTEVAGAPGYFVAQSGDYQPLDLVPCSHEPGGSATVAFLAIFVVTGKNEPEE